MTAVKFAAKFWCFFVLYLPVLGFAGGGSKAPATDTALYRVSAQIYIAEGTVVYNSDQIHISNIPKKTVTKVRLSIVVKKQHKSETGKKVSGSPVKEKKPESGAGFSKRNVPEVFFLSSDSYSQALPSQQFRDIWSSGNPNFISLFSGFSVFIFALSCFLMIDRCGRSDRIRPPPAI